MIVYHNTINSVILQLQIVILFLAADKDSSAVGVVVGIHGQAGCGPTWRAGPRRFDQAGTAHLSR